MRMKSLIALACSLLLALPASASDHGSPKLLQGDKIVFYGDSITQIGIGDPQYNGWLNLFQQAVENVVSVKIVDSGVPGYTTKDGAAHFNQLVLALHPSVVVIWLGINDIDTRTPSHKTHVNMEAMINACLVSGVREIVLVSPLGRGERADGLNPSFDEPIDRYARFLRDIAWDDTSGKIFYLPMRQYFLIEEARVNPFGLSDVLMRSDGLHPNGAGHMLIYQGFLAEFGFKDGELPAP